LVEQGSYTLVWVLQRGLGGSVNSSRPREKIWLSRVLYFYFKHLTPSVAFLACSLTRTTCLLAWALCRTGWTGALCRRRPPALAEPSTQAAPTPIKPLYRFAPEFLMLLRPLALAAGELPRRISAGTDALFKETGEGPICKELKSFQGLERKSTWNLSIQISELQKCITNHRKMIKMQI
jgi:hypothetical protein